MTTVHRGSAEDSAFVQAFEACAVSPEVFDHAAHIRLAYVYLCDLPTEAANDRFKTALLAWLAHNAVDPSKYHETITRAWFLAVAHVMAESAGCDSATAFVARHPRLLDRTLIREHYSEELLFSPRARQEFVQADLRAIPDHEQRGQAPGPHGHDEHVQSGTVSCACDS